VSPGADPDRRAGPHIVLVGMMGVGKTTVGRAVADALGWALLDSDQTIEARTGRTVAQIFATDGEPAFRAVETEVLAEALASTTPRVIAAAGGTVIDPGNRDVIRHGGLVVWLQAPVDVLVGRVAGSTHRPALAADPESTLYQLCEGRDELYAEVADLTVDATLSVASVVDAVLAAHASVPTLAQKARS